MALGRSMPPTKWKSSVSEENVTLVFECFVSQILNFEMTQYYEDWVSFNMNSNRVHCKDYNS